MSNRLPAGSLPRTSCLAVLAVALLPALAGTALAEAGAASARSGESPEVPRAPPETLVARVVVNGMLRGDATIVRDGSGRVLVPEAEFRRWGLTLPGLTSVTMAGVPHVEVTSLTGVVATFDPDTVTLDLRAVAQAFPATRLDLAPRRRADTLYPADDSIFLNYGISASGDADFDHRQYQMATEFGARSGNWLLYNTTNQVWGKVATGGGFTRLLTSAQYDDRQNLRRLTLGDFFLPSFDLAASVPLGGISLAKAYSIDPYFVPYPTASFQTEVALPSTVVVRVGGNVVEQRQVLPGPLDINHITGVTGAQNVSVVVRDPFGREQTLQQPFFFATNAGLAEGLHEYSYNLGFIRRDYGIESNDYGGLAVAAFHRYAFTDELTLGLRGQAASGVYNFGPFGSYQSPRLGLIAAGISIGGGSGETGAAGAVAYTYTGANLSLGVGARYLAREYAQLTDLVSPFRTRSDEYATASVFDPTLGTFTATYTGTRRYDGPTARFLTTGYTLSSLAGKGLLSLTYTHAIEPSSSYSWLLSFRYFFDPQTSMSAGVGGTRRTTVATMSLDRATPQGEGIGYALSGAHAFGGDVDGSYGQAFMQVNAGSLTVGANYARSGAGDAGPSFSQVFVSGSIGAVGGSLFAARPVQDSFALVRIPNMEGIPVYANGWYVGKTDSRGAVVATNLASYYDNYVSFGTTSLPLDYAIDRVERVISPPVRSGTLVAFNVRKSLAIYGTLVSRSNGAVVPLEFRDIRLMRDGIPLPGFTARRGEFYVEDLVPGEYALTAYGEPGCTARVVVPEQGPALVDLGVVICEAGR